MYFLDGREALLRNVRILCSALLSEEPDTFDGLAGAYRRLLIAEHGIARPYDQKPAPHVVADQEEAAAVRLACGVDGQPWPLLAAEALVQDALAHVAAFDAVLATLIRLTVGSVLVDVAPTPGSTTASRLLGVVWLSPAADWTPAVTAEAMIHEFTHTAQMIDERCSQHYLPAAYDDAATATSAIRLTQRPLRAVVPSIVVASEILAWRELTDLAGDAPEARLHGQTASLARGCLSSIESVNALADQQSLMTPRLRNLITRAGAVASRHVLEASA